MENENFVFDITHIDIDLSLDKAERVKELFENSEVCVYKKIVKVNKTKIYLNFLGKDKLTSKEIMKVLG